MEKEPIKSHEDLEVYKMAFDVAMKIFELSKKFPVEERYSLTDQIRRSSRSVCANLAEAWRKRGRGAGSGEQGRSRNRKIRVYQVLITPAPCSVLPASYEAAFIAKLNDSEAEAAETQTWLKFAVKCGYLDVDTGRELYGVYNRVLGILVTIINNPSPWLIKR